jgi:predicted RNA-binding protein (TIGR00451 family)
VSTGPKQQQMLGKNSCGACPQASAADRLPPPCCCGLLVLLQGAIKFVLSGANIMCPGLTSPGATIHDEVGVAGGATRTPVYVCQGPI